MNKRKIRKLGNYLLDAQARLSAVHRGSTIELLPARKDIDRAIEIVKELDKCDSKNYLSVK